ncbi:MAG: 3-hydroxyacyl-CoA dehydrogenase/enoyl-CoA hydratase family protein [Gemmatimonadetes bacterium]|nr:3-hydroxyacyl-CoA dehydrogenase/enoyl-CoA hydratase family protein [Gemmatimonadota bacterium]
MRIRRIGVVGAGIMGAGVAALSASVGIPAVLLDIPGSDDPKSPDRSGPARKGLEKAIKAKPAAFLDADRAALITTGNTADHLDLLAGCDWIVEAIIEKAAPKQELFAKLERVAPNAIVTSNTSGIPMTVLLQGRSAVFKRNFCGTHYFNPVRYMHLLEIIPTAHTAQDVISAIRHFHERVLGKGIVIAKDAPGFVANRIGIAGWATTMRLMMQLDLTIDEVDTLTGPLIARAKSATFRTGDLSGIDTLAHVTAGLSLATGEDFSMPPWVAELVKQNRLGAKTGEGFYKRVGKEIHTLDWKTLEYRPQKKVSTSTMDEILRLPAAQRVRKARSIRGRHGEFLRRMFVESSHYVADTTPELAYDITSVDRALEWGFAWEIGPYKVMDALGLSWLRKEFNSAGLSEPALIAATGNAFYKTGKKGVMVPGFESPEAVGPAGILPKRIVAEPVPGQISLAELRNAGNPPDVGLRPAGHVLIANDDARCVDIGDGVLCLEFCGKMNTLSSGVLDVLAQTIDRISREGYVGLVIGNDDSRTFTAGANLGQVAFAVAAGEWALLDAAVRRFQDSVMSVRFAPFPVVAAPFGLTLGGGCELSLHADRIQAHAELYMGLVEVGVGLIPGGCGTKEMLFRFTGALEPYEEADPFEAVKRAFKLIALAQMSTSAHEARKMGFLRPVADRITMNRDLLIADAKARVLDLAPDYVAPTMKTVRALGREALGNLNYALFAFQEGGQASAHDVFIGKQVAYVLSGGDGPPRNVTEQDILELEREAFLKLLGTEETQARIKHMLETGKPLRN